MGGAGWGHGGGEVMMGFTCQNGEGFIKIVDLAWFNQYNEWPFQPLKRKEKQLTWRQDSDPRKLGQSTT